MKTYEIKFVNCVAREIVQSPLSFEEIAVQLANGWLIIGGMVLNASIVEAVIEVEDNPQYTKE